MNGWTGSSYFVDVCVEKAVSSWRYHSSVSRNPDKESNHVKSWKNSEWCHLTCGYFVFVVAPRLLFCDFHRREVDIYFSTVRPSGRFVVASQSLGPGAQKNPTFWAPAKFLESWEKVCVSAARAQTCFMLDTIDQSRHDAKEAQTQHALQYHNITTAMSASSSFSGSTVTTSTQSATTDATHRSFSHTTTCASESIFSERLQ